MKHKTKILVVILLFVAGSLLFVSAAQAQANLDFLKGLVPCGTSYSPRACTVCDLFKLIQNLINFMLFVSAPLATLAAALIGLQFMIAGGSPAKVTGAKEKLKLLVIGLFWVFGSWIIIGTLFNFFANKSVFPWPWNQIQCSVPASSSQPTGGGAPAENEVENAGNPWGYSGTSLSDTVRSAAIERLDSETYKFGGGATGGGGAGGSWEDGFRTDTDFMRARDAEHEGITQTEPAPPYSSTEIVNPAVEPVVKSANTKGVDPNMVKAVIQAESAGNPNAVSHRGAYGLMQVMPDTARRYDPSLAGLTNAQIGEKLKDPVYNTEIGTAILQDLGAKYNGDLNKVIAAYNGGPGANNPSVNCSNSMRWQCQWDNNAHTKPNKGYVETRNYVNKVNNYYSQLSG